MSLHFPPSLPPQTQAVVKTNSPQVKSVSSYGFYGALHITFLLQSLIPLTEYCRVPTIRTREAVMCKTKSLFSWNPTLHGGTGNKHVTISRQNRIML